MISIKDNTIEICQRFFEEDSSDLTNVSVIKIKHINSIHKYDGNLIENGTNFCDMSDCIRPNDYDKNIVIVINGHVQTFRYNKEEIRDVDYMKLVNILNSCI